MFRRCTVAVLLLVVTLWDGGCTKGRPLMPTPGIYSSGDPAPFADVPLALQSNRVEGLYVTDRAVEEGSTAERPLRASKNGFWYIDDSYPDRHEPAVAEPRTPQPTAEAVPRSDAARPSFAPDQ